MGAAGYLTKIKNKYLEMNNYQKKIIKSTERFRPVPKYPTYPPYHEGYYMEEYFFNYFIKNKLESDRIYLPIYWTNIYNNIVRDEELQVFLNGLDPDLKYFTICQHERAPEEILPKNTLVFSGSGKIYQKHKSNNYIPIPLICSKIKKPKTNRKRDVFCSFIGSDTHLLRRELQKKLEGDENYYYDMFKWSPEISIEKEKKFIDVTERSVFTLCPRGDGPTSFRLYESMQLGSIPVYVYDTLWLPYTKEINWADICVLVHADELGHLKDIIDNISQERINYMRSKISEIYDEYFSLDGMCKKIFLRLKNEKPRLLTFYSDSHGILYKDYLKPSVDTINEYDLIPEKYEQIGGGNFMDNGWKDSMFKKLEFILQTIKECWGECFVFADADVIFLDKSIEQLKYELGDYDAAFQRDIDDLCAGFFIMRANNSSLHFIEECMRKYDEYPEDQTAMRLNNDLIKYKLLSNDIFNISMINGGKVWDGELFSNIPKNIKAFHANWSIGVKAKIDLFNIILESSGNKNLAFLKRKNEDIYFHKFKDGNLFVGNVQGGRMINGSYLKSENEIVSSDNKNSNKKLKVNVYFNYFQAQTEKRSKEIEYCLNKLISNEKVDRIYLLCSDEYKSSNSKMIKVNLFNIQPTFGDLFNIVNFNTKQDDLNILLNSDCYIDEENIELILNNITHDDVYCLSRWNITNLQPFKTEHYDIECSQDAWIFLGNMGKLDGDFKMGMPGCDNAIAHEFQKAGYKISNPSKDVKIYHYHFSDVRTYGVSHEDKESNRVRRPYVFVQSSKLREETKTKKVIFEGVVERNEKKITPKTTTFSSLSKLNKFVDNVYLINLKRREDRLNHMNDEFDKISISFKRFNAVDGKNLGDDLKSSQIATLRSHVGVVKDALRMGYDKIAIFEDDIVFCDDFNKRFEHYSENVPKDWDIMYLGAHFSSCKMPIFVGNYIYKVSEAYMCCAMILNNKNKLFEKIIGITKDEEKPIDNYFHDDILKEFKGYIFMPTFIKTWNTISDASEENINKTNPEVDKHFKNDMSLPNIISKETPKPQVVVSPTSRPQIDYVKSNQDICEDFVKGNLPFQIYHNNRLIFDSDASDKMNLRFFRDSFTLYGRQFNYQGMLIKRK